MSEQPVGRFWVIRHPATGGAKKTVAKFDTDTNAEIVPDEIAEHGQFVVQAVNGRSALLDDVDHSGLSQSEKNVLSMIYPVQR